MIDKETLETAVKFAVIGFPVMFFLENIVTYYTVYSDLSNNSFKNLRQQEDRAKRTLDDINKANWFYQYFFMSGSKLACERFLEEIDEEY